MKKKLLNFFTVAFAYFQMFKMKMFWFFSQVRGYPVATYTNPVDISYALKRGTRYKADPSWRDPVFHPTRIQRKLVLEKRIGDCDDHAIYWCTALIKSGLAKKVWFASFGYMKSNNTFGAHAVCVFIGLDNKMYWADYRDPYPVVIESNNMVPDGFEWVIGATQIYGKWLRSARMMEIRGLNKRDTPRFGKVTYFNPGPDTLVEDLKKV